MADPKIKYDIEANVEGNAEVNKLAGDIEKLAGTLDGDLKTKALGAADALRQLTGRNTAIEQFVQLKRGAEDAAKGLDQAQIAAQKMARELAGVETPTRTQTGQLNKLRDAVRAAKEEVTSSNVALNASRGALAQYGVTTDNVGAKQREVRTAIAAARTEIQALVPGWQQAGQAAQISGNQQAQAAQKVDTGLQGLSRQLGTLRNIATAALGGTLIGSLAKDVSDTADAYNNLAARIKLSTGEGAAFESAFQGVFEVAKRTNSEVEATGTLFNKINDAGKALGRTQTDALALTETINQAVQLSGASADASKAAITQLVQGLQSGALRGDEFNSVMEQSPRLAKALADGLSVTTGELRKQAEAGRLTSETVIKALSGQADAVAREFSKLPPTVGRAIQNLSTNWTEYVGTVDKASGASTAAAGAINALANNLSTIAGFLIDAGQAGAAFVALRLAQHFTGLGVAAQTAAVNVAASTAAVNAAGAAGTSAAVGIGRFATILASLRTFTLLGLVTNFKDIGTAIGEGVAKLQGYKDKSDEIARADELASRIAQQTIADQRARAAAYQAAIDKQLELSKAAGESIAKFDELRTKGESAGDALAKIGKDFDLANSPGIKNAGAVLDKLSADGKISAAEFQAAWSAALKTEDLAVFQTRATNAFIGSAREAERTAQVIDASLRESVRRAGLDFSLISGGMGAAARSAINDTDAMIRGLDRLKASGADVGLALSASLSKGINTADSQRAIESVRGQIESLRKVLGEPITNGLLDQAKQKALELKDAMDKALPGVTSVREAMAQLGITTDQTLQDTARKSAEAYEVLRNSGTASAREIAEGFRKYATDAIAANQGIATAAVEVEGAIRNVAITSDATGRSIVGAFDDGTRAAANLGAQVVRTTGNITAMGVSAATAQAQVQQLIDLQQRQQDQYGRPGEGRSASVLDKSGQIATDNTEAFAIRDKLRKGTLTAADAQSLQNVVSALRANEANDRQLDKFGGVFGAAGLRDRQEWQAVRVLLEQQLQVLQKGGVTIPGAVAAPPPPAPRVININLNGQQTSLKVATDADANALENFLKQLGVAKSAAGF